MLMIMLVIFLSMLCILVNNVIVWWSIFLLMTLIFVMLNKSLVSFSSLFNYFIMQESLGLLFLLMTFGYFQLLIVLMKIGVAPMHFWIFSVLNNVYGFNLMWFLTFQKLPFMLILLQLLINKMLLILLFGLLVCMVQMLLTKSYKNLLILSSTESFNWIILGFVMSFVSVFMIFLYYMLLMVFLIPKFELMNYKSFLGWETMLIFMNLPFSVNFFVKILALSEMLKVFNYMVLLLLFLMFLSVLSLSFWMINLSVKNMLDYKYMKNLYFYCLPMMLLVIV